MKIAVMNNFDGDEFGFQYLNLKTLTEYTNDLHTRLKIYFYFRVNLQVSSCWDKVVHMY